MNTNQSETTWVLVYDAATKQVIEIVPPGAHTQTMETLKEFTTEEELNQYVQDNGLITSNT